MKIVSDNADIERHLSHMHELIVGNGGYVHKDIIVEVKDGNLSIKAPRTVPERTQLLALPEALLLPIDGFGLHLEGDDVCLGEPAEGITPLQVELMEDMAAIYNLTGKIAFHKKYSVSRLYVDYPDVFRNLVFENQFKMRENAKDKDFWLYDFLHTRQFGMKNKGQTEGQGEGRAPGAGDPLASVSVLMPIIDFLNHHQSAAGFIMRDGQLSVVRRSPIDGSDECFVSYSRMDAQIAFANYGFVDLTSDYLLSAPLTMNLPAGITIKVNRFPGAARKASLPPQIKDIQKFVPQISIEKADRLARLSVLIVPDAMFPRSMRRVLSMVLNALAQEISPAMRMEILEEAERQVIAANRQHYNELKRYVAGLNLPEDYQSILDDAVTMATHQISILDAYLMNIEQALKNDN